MDELIIDNVRCFYGNQRIPLAPLTILVGENSSGKSTILACARAATSLYTPDSVGLNTPPFSFGSFSSVVSTPARKKKPETFSIGFKTQLLWESEVAELVVDYARDESDTVCRSWTLTSSEVDVRLDFKKNTHVEIDARVLEDRHRGTARVRFQYSNFMPLYLKVLWKAAKLEATAFEKVDEVLAKISRSVPDARAFAPVRTRPKRTYEVMSAKIEPDGGHVPGVLARTLRLGAKGEKRFKQLSAALRAFGRGSGLFEEIRVERWGKSLESPFRVEAKVGGKNFNLIDVGYGVSQALPILVDATLYQPTGKLLLIQQPEVHLHPRAQAQLGTFFSSVVSEGTVKLVVETHSDYLIDRVLMDVRDESSELKAEDVLVLFCERQQAEVAVHPIRVSPEGTLVDPPDSYRAFFMEEELRYLGVRG